MSRITLIYDLTKHTTPADGLIEDSYQLALKLAKEYGQTARHISSYLMLLRFRVGLVEKDFDELVIRYKGVDYPVDEKGMFDTHVHNEIDLHFEWLLRLVNWQ